MLQTSNGTNETVASPFSPFLTVREVVCVRVRESGLMCYFESIPFSIRKNDGILGERECGAYSVTKRGSDDERSPSESCATLLNTCMLVIYVHSTQNTSAMQKQSLMHPPSRSLLTIHPAPTLESKNTQRLSPPTNKPPPPHLIRLLQPLPRKPAQTSPQQIRQRIHWTLAQPRHFLRPAICRSEHDIGLLDRYGSFLVTYTRVLV